MTRPLEGLLRPPVEWYSFLIEVIFAIFLILQPDMFLFSLLPKYTLQIAAAVLCVFALIRFWQGYKVFRYQRRLKRMPDYSLAYKNLPVSKKRLFLGKGFQWTTQHTQRLRDLDLDYNLPYKTPSKIYNWARNFEKRHEKTFLLKDIAQGFQSNSFFNPFRPYPDIGGEPYLHGVSDKEQDIWLSLIERAGHISTLGTTGVGKTRFAELLISQDIHRGDVVIVLDPKGDADLLMRLYIEAKRSHRENDLMIFHLGFPEFSCRYNAIGNFTKVTQVATRISNGLPSTGESAAFKEFAWKYINLVTRALLAMSVRPTYKIIQFYITRLDELLIRYCEEFMSKKDTGNYEKFIANYIIVNSKENNKTGEIKIPSRKQAIMGYAKTYIENLNKKEFGEIQSDIFADLYAASLLDKSYYDKITASVSPLLEKLCTGDIAELLSPNYEDLNDHRPILDWLEVIRHKKIVYVGMDALTDNIVSATVGNAMLSDLVSVAGHLYNFGLDQGFQDLQLECKKANLPRICLHADEFNEIIGDEFIPLLNKARGAGFVVTTYTQTWSDVEARLVSSAKAGQTAGNLNVVVMFRTKEAKTVDMLLNQLPKVPILRVVPASSSSDSAHGEDGKYYSSNNEDRFAHAEMRLIEQNDVLNLPKGQAFCLLEGGKLFKIRVPLPDKNEDKLLEIPSSLKALSQKMKERMKLDLSNSSFNSDSPIVSTGFAIADNLQENS